MNRFFKAARLTATVVAVIVAYACVAAAWKTFVVPMAGGEVAQVLVEMAFPIAVLLWCAWLWVAEGRK